MSFSFLQITSTFNIAFALVELVNFGSAKKIIMLFIYGKEREEIPKFIFNQAM